MVDPFDRFFLAGVRGRRIDLAFRRIRDVKALLVAIIERADQLPFHDEAEMPRQIHDFAALAHGGRHLADLVDVPSRAKHSSVFFL
ncbi:MAG: hypothetical protein QM811_20525 [Pirellulales bacterium]